MQFKIIPGHHGGIVSQMGAYRFWHGNVISFKFRFTHLPRSTRRTVIDPGARFLVSASGNRGWHGDATRTVFVHDIKTIL